jgi:hypothetical protein
MRAAPSPDGRHDDLDADELAGLALVVPDDPRSLDADRAVYLRERGGRSGALMFRSYVLGRFPSASASSPLILMLVLVVALIAGSLALESAGLRNDPLTPPALANPTAPVGSVGGLLPDVTLSIYGQTRSVRDIRPAVFVLLPATCPSTCSNAVRNLQGQANEYGLPVFLVGPESRQYLLEQVDRSALGDDATIALDAQNALGNTYLPTGVTTLLVHADGVLGSVLYSVDSTIVLGTKLSQLGDPGAASSSSIQ